jgi:two-component system sensor histidine kinase HydH
VAVFTSKAEALTGLSAQSVLGQPLTVLPAVLQQAFEEVFASGQSEPRREIALGGADGATAPMSLCIEMCPAGQGQGLRTVAVLHELSPARKLEMSIRRLDRLASIGTLSASMGHEIKNALVGIKTFVDLLLAQNKDAELAKIVSREMRRVDSIVSQMLKFAGPAKPTFALLRIHAVLDASLQLVQPQLEGKKISLHRAFTASLDLVHGDGYQLEQAFLNLFLNAIEAMRPDGVLNVATELQVGEPQTPFPLPGPKPMQLRVTIHDTGTGIPPENLGRLFEPFFTTKQNGTGLGLPITRRIIEEHRGTINVVSELNKGTTFSVVFPAHTKPR